MGCGSEENFGTEKMTSDLKSMGINVEFYESPGTHHEWLTWRRCLRQYLPHLFKKFYQPSEYPLLGVQTKNPK